MCIYGSYAYTEVVHIQNLHNFYICTSSISHIFVYAQLWYMCNCTYTKIVHMQNICAYTEDVHMWKLCIYGGCVYMEVEVVQNFSICSYMKVAHIQYMHITQVVHIGKLRIYRRCAYIPYIHNFCICTYLLYMLCTYLLYMCNLCICTYTEVAHNFRNIHIRQPPDIHIFRICATSLYAYIFHICTTSLYAHI